MNRELLLHHFNCISDAPDAIPRLRQFVLDLAVRGKLVEQDPTDEPAADLISEIAAIKLQAGKSTEAIRLESISANVGPFKIPSSWIWVRLGDLCTKTGSGSTPRGGKSVYQPSGVPFLRSQNVHDDGLRLDDVAFITPQTHEKMAGTAVEAGDLLLNITGGSIGRCCLVPASLGQANVSQHVAIIRTAVEDIQSYLHRLILSPYFQSFVISEQTGAGRGGLPKNRMDRIPVALPPVAEQRRILSRIDELMDLCNQLQTVRTLRENQRDMLTAAAHYHLHNGVDPEALTEHTGFFIEHLPHLTARPDQINQLRQTILNLAVRGQLVPQNNADEDARNLLQSIEAERKRRIEGGEVKKAAPLATNGSEVKFDFVIPPRWIFCFIDDIALKVTDGEHATPRRCQSGHYLLSARNVTNAGIDVSDVDFVPEEEFRRIRKRCDPDKGDILISCSGSVGRVAVVDKDDAYSMVRSAALIKLDALHTDPRYIAYALRATPAQEQIELYSKSTAQANLFIGAIRKLRIPLPPFPEQQRIVSRVDELMALCTQLETQLTVSQSKRSGLLEAVLFNALNGAHSADHTQLAIHA
jgi:type I restriction enzyme S subunit